MKKTICTLAVALCLAPVMAETSDVESEGSGFLTSALNNAIESAMTESPAAASSAQTQTSGNAQMEYGRTVTDYVSAPKFGGYYIGRYQYSDKDGAKGGAGFNQRLIRLYVDGTILKDFKYRIQLQTTNASFHVKDVFLEWQRYKFAMIKIGQFKRAFGFENPMNPWDISSGDYSYFTKNMTGDYRGDSWSGGGRDQGLQVQGDFLKVGQDNHNLIHYQVGIWNGTGINKSDNDGSKDVIGTLQVQPVKNLYIGLFGWTGKATVSGVEENREKYAFGLKYENQGWSLRGEWGHAHYTTGNDDVWYVVGGMPVNSWFKLCAQYQTYRPGKEWSNAQCSYSFIPEFQLHKNLKFQLQYNYNNKRADGTDRHYNEIWAQTYFRF
ncbi:MAG: OprO/OprP family phosphate-selective porin [Bacteroidales bacterium]|nr:OprO/OprP family phosphate-selective porin [Bacteroidales bacterium]